MKKWFEDEVLKSVTIWLWIILFISSTIFFAVGKIDGITWVSAQGGFAAIAMTKRAVTQNIEAGK